MGRSLCCISYHLKLRSETFLYVDFGHSVHEIDVGQLMLVNQNARAIDF